MPPPASRKLKPAGLWSRPSLPCTKGAAPEFAGPDNQSVLEQAAGSQVLDQAGDGLVDVEGVGLVAREFQGF